MTTTTLNQAKGRTFENRKEHKSFFERYKEAFRENQASIICGMLAMNGATNVYPLYKSLSK